MTKRARSDRREGERKLDKLTRDRRKLHALEPGSSSDNPIEVVSTSVIEPKVRSFECPRCGPQLRVTDQAARVVAARVHRIMTMRCTQCGETRELHFAVVAPLVQ